MVTHAALANIIAEHALSRGVCSDVHAKNVVCGMMGELPSCVILTVLPMLLCLEMHW